MDKDVSIHAPNEGSDLSACFQNSNIAFQSTLPMKGATHRRSARNLFMSVSIHAPNEGSDPTPLPVEPVSRVSIHAPNEGSDDDSSRHRRQNRQVSIHAPNEGSD